jgi:Gram-negative bacterial TonB protein C-terminal
MSAVGNVIFAQANRLRAAALLLVASYCGACTASKGATVSPFPPISSLAPKGVVPFGPQMTRPVMLYGRLPAYTSQAVDAGVEGLFLVACVITVSGEVESCRVVKTLLWLETEVLSALKTQRYEPATKNGRPIAVFYVFPFRFRVQPGERVATPKLSPTTPPFGPDDTEEQYTSDLRSICHYHELSGQPPGDRSRDAVTWWFIEHIHTTRARQQLAQLPRVARPAWVQNLRHEAEARGISPCPFDDT